MIECSRVDLFLLLQWTLTWNLKLLLSNVIFSLKSTHFHANISKYNWFTFNSLLNCDYTQHNQTLHLKCTDLKNASIIQVHYSLRSLSFQRIFFPQIWRWIQSDWKSKWLVWQGYELHFIRLQDYTHVTIFYHVDPINEWASNQYYLLISYIVY